MREWNDLMWAGILRQEENHLSNDLRGYFMGALLFTGRGDTKI
jgi:hypothetical protein